MDLNTMLQIILIVDGVLAIYFMMWIMITNAGGGKPSIKRKPKNEELIKGVVGKDIFTCPYGHHFLRDEAIMFADNMNREVRIYCPKCWEKGRRVLVAREKMDMAVIEAPKEFEERKVEEPHQAGYDVFKVFEDLNVRIRKMEEMMNMLTERVSNLERSETATVTIEDEETGEVTEEEVEPVSKKRRRRKK